jgi:hypothetical protein
MSHVALCGSSSENEAGVWAPTPALRWATNEVCEQTLSPDFKTPDR